MSSWGDPGTFTCPVCLVPCDGIVHQNRTGLDLSPLVSAPVVHLVREVPPSRSWTHFVAFLHFPNKPAPRAHRYRPYRIVIPTAPGTLWVWRGDHYSAVSLPFTVPAGGAIVAVPWGPRAGEPFPVRESRIDWWFTE